MKPRLLHSVIDDVLAAAEQWPELASEILHFVFDEGHAIREGLYETRTRVLDEFAAKTHDGRVSVASAAVVSETIACDRLVQFARAATHGFIPHVMLAGGA